MPHRARWPVDAGLVLKQDTILVDLIVLSKAMCDRAPLPGGTHRRQMLSPVCSGLLQSILTIGLLGWPFSCWPVWFVSKFTKDTSAEPTMPRPMLGPQASCQ